MNSAIQAMYKLLQRDPRYKLEAYQFVREALAFAQEHMSLLEPAASETTASPAGEALEPQVEAEEMLSSGRHITGQQLCQACRLYGLQQYGYLTSMVLANWGVRSTSDFGEIVYNLIQIQQMRKSESDSREDFDNVYSFDTAFEPQFDCMTSDSAG